MNKLRPRNKICFQNNENAHPTLNLKKLNKKKWYLLKKNLSPFSLRSMYQRKRLEKKKNFYRERLFNKQQLKHFYGCIPEYQLKNLFRRLKKQSNSTKLPLNHNLLQRFIVSLESRLDIILFRLKITRSIFESKQIINHGKVCINGKSIVSQNYHLKKGDLISFSQYKVKNRGRIKVPYLEYNRRLQCGVFLKSPTFQEIQYPFSLNLKLIDEFFQKH